MNVILEVVPKRDTFSHGTGNLSLCLKIFKTNKTVMKMFMKVPLLMSEIEVGKF